MGILTNLNNGQKIRFEQDDTDIWGYNGNELQQYVDGKTTGNTLPVISVDEDNITIDWGDVQSTLLEDDFIFVD
jgi:uncharacterized protein YegJ (DUF2314 family)